MSRVAGLMAHVKAPVRSYIRFIPDAHPNFILVCIHVVRTSNLDSNI